MFVVSDKENVLKPFQQNIISEVEREFNVKDLGLLCYTCCIAVFLPFQTWNSDIWNNKCL